eukprot:GHVR01054374.1.p1 GENE.GHVR01054374.1~~GHVR01054374.1.p1  ORF type:complete len:104 (+),score=13.55 GHVR01054374.1:642-953(+)
MIRKLTDEIAASDVQKIYKVHLNQATWLIQLYSPYVTKNIDFKLYGNLSDITAKKILIEGATDKNKESVSYKVTEEKDYYIMVEDKDCDCPYTLTVSSGIQCQ